MNVRSVVRNVINFHKGSRVARVTGLMDHSLRCSLIVFVIVIVFVYVMVFLLVRSCLVIILIKCLKGHTSVASFVKGVL